MDSLYQAELLALSRLVRGLPDLKNPTHSLSLNNPTCGDKVHLSVIIKDGHLHAHHISAEGCALCAAGAGLWYKLSANDTPDGMRNKQALVAEYLNNSHSATLSANLASLKVFTPVKLIKNRHKCVSLAFDASAKLSDLL